MERQEQRQWRAGEMNIYRSSGVYWEIVGVLPPDFQVVGCFRRWAPFVEEVLVDKSRPFVALPSKKTYIFTPMGSYYGLKKGIA